MRADVLRTIRRERMLVPGEPVWVAVSGGVDSMVLLHVLRELGHPCHVAHVDHGLRGEASDADRTFVEEQAKAAALPFRSVRVDVHTAAEGISVQMAARELRYAWFRELLDEGPSALALGHHRDDLAETMLLHLLRGIGTQGWRGMPPVARLGEGRLCRPLLAVDREQVQRYAAAHGIPFREDASNADPHYLRNRVRAELLPLMEDLRPGARRTVARGAQLLGELGQAAERQLAREEEAIRGEAGGDLHIPFRLLEESPAPRLLLLRLLQAHRPHPDLIEQLLEAVQERATGKRFPLGGRHIAVESARLRVVKPSVGFPSFTISASEAEQGSAGPFSWRICPVSEVELGQGMSTAWLDLGKLEFPLRMRPWQAGDRMRPLGLGGSKRISDMLVDAGVPAADKAGAYVLLSGARILWLPGHRIAEECTPDAATEQVLRVTFRPGRDHHL